MGKKENITKEILEAYCLGTSSREDNEYLEHLAAKNPAIQEEITKIKNSFRQYGANELISPRPSVKHSLMRKIYKQQSEIDKTFVPLMDEPPDFNKLYGSAMANQLKFPTAIFSNLSILNLPSTREVTNLAVWIKKGTEEEVHTDTKEYIAILEGSCDMYFGTEKYSYTKGQVISVPLNVVHHGIVTSAEPMFALVQRQMI